MTPSPAPATGLIGAFAGHRIICNLLMLVMLLAGAFALTKLNVQFFPTFNLDIITVEVRWDAASAEDVEAAVAAPLERELGRLGAVKKMSSTSRHGRTKITIEYEEGTDLSAALDEVSRRVASIRDLPASAKAPVIRRVVHHEPVARLLVTGDDRGTLRPIVRRIQRELLGRGIENVSVVGLPSEEIAIEVPSAALRQLDMSIADIADRVTALSRDLPAGAVGGDLASKRLRVLAQERDEAGFERLALHAGDDGRLLTLGDVATVERRARSDGSRLTHEGRPAVSLTLGRTVSADSLESGRILQEWLDEQRGQWPPGVSVVAYDESWKQIRERTDLLVANGVSGLILVVVMLFLFLDGRVAFWVAVGVPVSFMATLAVLLGLGGTLNMMSLLALIMALGIIVDDAVVVGEDALARHRDGAGALEAAEGGARRMLAPVLASSFTTIAGFMPMMLVGGPTGRIIFDVPLVVICVVLVSLVDCFLVLPGHLHRGFRRREQREAGRIRRGLDRGFESLRDRIFRPLARAVTAWPMTAVCTALAMLALTAGLAGSGRIGFYFLPVPEATVLDARVQFAAGTPPQRVERFMTRLEQTLRETEAGFGEKLVELAVARVHRQNPSASLHVQLVEPDRRNTRNTELVTAWRERAPQAPGLESLSMVERRTGPPGRDIDLNLTGTDSGALKAAALEIASALRAIPGVSGVTDNMPFGQEQLAVRPTSRASALGLTTAEVGAQLRAAYRGQVAQTFQHEGEEIEVRVSLPDSERRHVESLSLLPITLPGGGTIPLPSAVEIEPRSGFDRLQHLDGSLSVQVSADVDPAVANVNVVLADLREGPLPAILARHGVGLSLEGRQADQRATLGDMQWGAGLALVLIYLVLAVVFSSYGWPLLVMVAVPFGLIGAVVGHWLLGVDLSAFSLLGFFGLSGIVVNGSIILFVSYKALKGAGVPWREAIVEAACGRLRAVLLTSLTTIGGLTPLLFESSPQAQFLIPMAVSIAFGLAVATFVVLLLLPALLALYEAVATRWGRA